jgi:predicted RNase H-like HicB family nuclease
MKANSKTLRLTGIFIKEPSDGRFTAFISEVPAAVSQGKTQQEAEENLLEILPMALEAISDSFKEKSLINGVDPYLTTKEYQFQIAKINLGTVMNSNCTCKNAELEKDSLVPVYCHNCNAYVGADD